MAGLTVYDPKNPRRTFRGEERWFALLEEMGPRRFRAALILLGVSPAIAGNIVWFLDDQRQLERHLTEPTRGKYRKILSGLDPDKVRRAIPGLFKWAAA